jgi:two-component system, LuxR family, response regulator FixJ
MSETAPVVIVVDDDEAIRESLSALLGSHGYGVQSYARATDFLQSAASCAAHGGCVLLDVRLPDLTGLEVLHRLSEAFFRLPVIMITAYGDVPMAVAAMRAGAADFLEKPYTEEDLLGSIAAALQRERREAETGEDVALVASRLETLTPREHDVLELLVAGKQNKQIAYDLGISPRTVEIHRARVMEKMAATSISHLVRMVVVARVGNSRSS